MKTRIRSLLTALALVVVLVAEGVATSASPTASAQDADGAMEIVVAAGSCLRVFPSADEQGPITSNVVANPNPVAVGGDFVLTATVDDSTTGNSNIASAQFTKGGMWNPMDAADVFDSPTEDVIFSLGGPASPGIYTMCVRGTDAADNTGDAECISLAVR